MTGETTTTVTFTVTDVARIRNAGRLVALASVELELEGVVLGIQGVRVVREGDRVRTQPPRYRDPATGTWKSAVVVPRELGRAIGQEVCKLLRADHLRTAIRPPRTP